MDHHDLIKDLKQQGPASDTEAETAATNTNKNTTTRNGGTTILVLARGTAILAPQLLWREEASLLAAALHTPNSHHSMSPF
eukprot:9038990-Ditylum_brightwellii.AAC.1